jgi:uncharacterized protein
MDEKWNHILHQIPHSLHPVFAAAIGRFQLDEMSIHGPSHWIKVFRNATDLATPTPGADRLVCQLFALLHDCERRNEFSDPQHGPRAAAYAIELQKAGTFSLTASQLKLLCDACTAHDNGLVSSDPTIGACWDADRLDLPRVGIRVDSQYLSTDYATKLVQA